MISTFSFLCTFASNSDKFVDRYILLAHRKVLVSKHNYIRNQVYSDKILIKIYSIKISTTNLSNIIISPS